ncbi:protein SET DOMAIN GROUP 41 isoform X2 [Andrographis paniculata]|uniref:protein SET DOMAIN GROUP 41 isoform X2 n=1 Tax=Andrographis paniculata TaxID=175694 RepID=UPI0021E74930|nr:protein SET DOMAIN GROUP 41 isoform X2 [Andrographis paniculata]
MPKMEMRATEDIAIGCDLTPPVYPLAFVLQDSDLASRCSACFSPLPPRPFHSASHLDHRFIPDDVIHTPLYCSLHCSSLESSINFSYAELHLLHNFRQSSPSAWEDSSDLRLSIRLLRFFERLRFRVLSNSPDSVNNSCRNDSVLERIAGLMTNREDLMIDERCEDSLFERVKEGAKLLATARRMCAENLVDSESPEKEKENVLEEMLLCLVLTNAVEVQDHSGCREQHMQQQQQPSRIAPAAKESGSGNGIDHSLVMETDLAVPEGTGYGPRVIVRSIKRVRKGDEVTIAYTDLLQPKEMRQSELWLKYRFNCRCQRCSAMPITYVDYCLQVPYRGSIDGPVSLNIELEDVLGSIDDTISDYLSIGDAKSCCEKLESLLSYEPESPLKLKLNPFHFLSQNAYITLASANKVVAIEREMVQDSLKHYKTSAAYSLLLAGVVHHLFMSESSLIAAVANFFGNAGESLSTLAGSSLWDSKQIHQELSPLLKCDICCLSFEPNCAIFDQDNPQEEVKIRLFNCIAEISRQVWSTLACGNSFLKSIRNPVDFRWPTSPEAEEYDDSKLRVLISVLGLHCLRYGSILSSICYGRPRISKDLCDEIEVVVPFK